MLDMNPLFVAILKFCSSKEHRQREAHTSCNLDNKRLDL